MNVLLTLRVAYTLHENFFADMEASPGDLELHETKAELTRPGAGPTCTFEQIISALNKLQKRVGNG